MILSRHVDLVLDVKIKKLLLSKRLKNEIHTAMISRLILYASEITSQFAFSSLLLVSIFCLLLLRPKVTAEWLAFPLHTQEIQDQTGYPDRFSWFYPVPQDKRRDNTLN
jgi:hypothetical protein